MTTAAPIDPHLFTWPSERPQLIGSGCTGCGVVTFPRQGSCPRCSSTAMEDKRLSPTGTLWSATVQRFAPPAPYIGGRDFEPYGVGYVELPDGVVVEGRLTTTDPELLEIGRPMELVVVPFAERDGVELLTYAFAPAEVAS